MSKKILIIQGHPDPAGGHLCHALAEAYSTAAVKAGHTVEWIEVTKLEFPLLRSKHDWRHEPVPESLRSAQAALLAADHLLILYPLWLGDMPALLKGFFEQTIRPGAGAPDKTQTWHSPKPLAGTSARVVVTMGMPGFFYRWYYFAHSLKSLERNILAYCGVGPVRDDVIGPVDTMDPRECGTWLDRMADHGRYAI